MPSSRMRYLSASPISSSTISSRSLRPSISVTATPSVAKMLAYSVPMMPPPTMVNDLGIASRSRIPSLSTTRFWSNGIWAGRAGFDPVARMIFSARTSKMELSVWIAIV